MLAPPEPVNIQSELNVEDDFVDVFREEQQRQEQQFEFDAEMGEVEDAAEESRGEEEEGEEEEGEKEIEEQTKEQEEYEDMSHEQNIRVHLPGRDKIPIGELTPVSVGPDSVGKPCSRDCSSTACV